ncbi:zinc finger MYM-type protein 2 [Dendrobates tinctorius]|uniref:zinc finger MYM-type protein 2 n=1 Tax=Dendrobates tinctorius TaxID=92724 RepID=UPI003CC9F8C2
MATGLKNVGHAFGGPTSSKTFQTTSVIVDDDDDVVFIEPVQVPQNVPTAALRSVGFSSTKENHRADLKSHSSSSKDLDLSKGIISETIIIDDEEEPPPSRVHDKNASTFTSRRLMDSNRSVNKDYPSSSSFSRNKPSSGLMSSGITTEPDSEIQIANVTTLDSGITSASDGHHQTSESRDMNLMITHVTSLQNPGMGDVPNGLQSNFGGHVPNFPPSLTSQTKSTSGPYNPGRINVGGDVFQNGESTTHHTSDAWISQSASFPRNQQPGVDTMSPVASLPKQVLQSLSQQPSKAVKVTCANCKKPLQKGQTAYQRKGSTHLFCSTTCLSSFSQKPATKKLCTMCKKDITAMKGTIVAQVDSSESFQEFCSTYCLSLYEDKQNSAKNQNKSRCTICGKLTEIRHEVSFKNMTHKLCSDHCFNRYRMANGLIMNCCEHCGEYLPSKGAGDNVLMVDGQWKRFCSPACLNEFKLKHGKLTSCTGCKAQCRIFDMTQCIGSNGHMEPYCSTTCMNSHKAKYAKPPPPPPPPPVQSIIPTQPGIICHFCKRNSLPQYQATMPDGKLYNFCSSGCVAKFQTLTMQSSTNGQHVSDIQLKCNYCKNVFSSKPVTLDWEKKVHQFCSKICCEDYKKLHCIVTFCEYCQEEKTLHDTMKFSGVKKPFCSEGCKLLYKQDFAKRLGLKCVTCNYCFQMCRRGATREFDGKIRDFCTEDCSRKFQDWYYKAARCDCCRTQGTLKEKVQWRGTIKNFCDQHCLLRFYSQQNEPNMTTQKGPENMYFDQGSQASRPRATGPNSSCSPAAPKDMKNKAVLCKPLSMTKATYCKPHMQAKSCQKEEELDSNTKYVPVPIPVPVYIPVPMNLYSQKVPASAPLPFPIPVPILVPADFDKIKELHEDLCRKDIALKVEDDLKSEDVKGEETDDSISLIEDITEDRKIKDEHPLDWKVLKEEIWHNLINDEEKLEKNSLKEEVVKKEELMEGEVEEIAEDEIKEVEEIEDEIKEVEEIEDEIKEVEEIEDEIKEVEEIEDEIKEVEEIEDEIKEVDEIEDEIKEVDEIEDEIKEVDEIEDEIKEVDEIEDEIKEVEEIEDEIKEVEEIEDEIKEDEVKEVEEIEEDEVKEVEVEEDEVQEEEIVNLDAKEEISKVDFLLIDSPLPFIESDVLDTTVAEDKLECGIDEDSLNTNVSTNCIAESPAGLSDFPNEPELDLEIDFPRAAEEFDTESEFLLPPVFEEEYEDQPKPKPLKKGAKRKAVSDQSCSENSESLFPLKYSYAINAWKYWVKARIAADELTEYKSVRLKEDLLLHPPSALSYWLSCFIKEVQRPNGDSYAPDSIYYLCLGIQEFLSVSQRTESIFHDQDYETFGQGLNDILRSWQPSILPDGSIFSRVEELYLWQANQLGTQSSMSLLFTLFYFNTKYFNLRTVDQHLRLSFGSVLKQWKGNPLTQEKKACLQYQASSLFESHSEDKVVPGKRKYEDDETFLEQIENTADPSRCPVKIFEYYLSKSPENLSQRMDVFYLTPECPSSVSSLWFTSNPLDRNTLENMLIRVLLVKDIYDKNSYELDEDTD